MSLNSQETCAAIYRQLFTDEEWNVIDCALSEYQDHFDGSETPEEIAYERVQDKISAIFDLTKGNWNYYEQNDN